MSVQNVVLKQIQCSFCHILNTREEKLIVHDFVAMNN